MRTAVSALGRRGGRLRGEVAAQAGARRVHATLARSGAAIPVRLWDGTELGPDDADYRLVLRHPWSLRAMLVPPDDRSAGEAYLRDAIDVEGSMIEALRDAARVAAGTDLVARAGLARDLLVLPRPPHDRAPGRTARLRGRAHSPARDRAAVGSHYDVGNDFYRLLLGESLVYSCAYFTPADAAPDGSAPDVLDPAILVRAQQRKLDLVCRKLGLEPGRRLLDIGCGWGSLVLHAARHHGARVLGITLSHEQAALARERVEQAGLADRVEIRLADYREVDGTYDAVCSIGMFEHVGAAMFDTYFRRARALTAPGGRFLNHAITTGTSGETREHSPDGRSFIGAHVFPDGALAPAHVQVALMERAGFELLDVHQLRPHYALTLRHWLANLERHATATRATAGEVVYRTWRAYMAGAVVGFESGDLGLVQVLGVDPGARDVPLDRAWMEPGGPAVPLP